MWTWQILQVKWFIYHHNRNDNKGKKEKGLTYGSFKNKEKEQIHIDLLNMNFKGKQIIYYLKWNISTNSNEKHSPQKIL